MFKSDSHSDSRIRRRVGLLTALTAVTLLGLACGSDGEDTADAGTDGAPTVVVTTNILGDVVSNLLGDSASIETIMPTGADPHEFQASAQQVAAIDDADVLVVNGAGFEEGLTDVIEAAEADGTAVCVAIDHVDTIEFGSDAHTDEHDEDDDHSEDEHDDEEAHEEGDDHDHDGTDPHFFTDPARMAVAADGLTGCIVDAVAGLERDDVAQSADDYIAELGELDAEVESTVAAVPDDRRVLVTNHEVFGYFADRYDFEIAGAILPSSTQSEADAATLAELADVVEAEGVPAIFADTSGNDQLADALAAEIGDVEVVELFSESLGPDGGETYLDMVRTNATRISDALG